MLKPVNRGRDGQVNQLDKAESTDDLLQKIANLISKLNFYKLIPYPMDNC